LGTTDFDDHHRPQTIEEFAVPTEPVSEFDLGPLSWVQSEIDQALKRALESLAAFQKSPEDGAALEHARKHLHQAAGAIKMVGLDAVVAFTDEIEQHLACLQEHAPQDLPGACDVVERACRRLSVFLAELADGDPPVPLKLFPEYQALQAARGITVVTLTDLFYPDLNPRAPGDAPQETISAKKLPSYLVKQRRLYEQGLLAWLGGDEEASRTMRDAIAGIEHVTTHTGLRSFWWTVGALFEALSLRGVESGYGVKQLAVRVDLQIRRAVEGSAKAADRLRREVLYYVAISAPVGPQVQAVQRAFRLTTLVPAADVIGADVAAMRSLVRKARDQLVAAKDTWLKVASGRPESRGKLKQMLSSVHTSAAEMNHYALMKLIAALGECLDGLPPGAILEPLATEYATALLLAERAFENYGKLAPDFAQQVDAMLVRLDAARVGRVPPRGGAPLFDAMNKRVLLGQVGREIHVNLHRMEDALDAFFRDNSKRVALASLPEDSRQIRGALRILGLEDADHLMALCEQQIQAFANPATEVSSEDLELLAESLAGLGFYIKAVEQQHADSARWVTPLLAKRLSKRPLRLVEETAAV
jgi:chemosensory pili system protein ChpA (sensor histidine kinase/response regulator)